MPETTLRQPLVWIDLEMTGLEPATDTIMEIACIVTDGSLEKMHEVISHNLHVVFGANRERLFSSPWFEAFQATWMCLASCSGAGHCNLCFRRLHRGLCLLFASAQRLHRSSS